MSAKLLLSRMIRIFVATILASKTLMTDMVSLVSKGFTQDRSFKARPVHQLTSIGLIFWKIR